MGGGGGSGGTSLALRALYADDAVKHPLTDLTPFSKPCDPDPDDGLQVDDDEDNDDSCMDPITFARYYAATSLAARTWIVQEHDRKMSEHFDQRIVTWVEGVQFVRS